jgi:hypothetical protein
LPAFRKGAGRSKRTTVLVAFSTSPVVSQLTMDVSVFVALTARKKFSSRSFSTMTRVVASSALQRTSLWIELA